MQDRPSKSSGDASKDGRTPGRRRTSARSATPMLRHYLEIKERYPEEILFYRVGDFFEMFYEDALRASRLLDIALTSRDKNSENPVPLCGVPHHAVNAYISRLVEQGHKVAVCDQVEDARHAQGLVRREVTRVITPGTLIEDEHLEARGNNFLLGLAAGEDRIGLAHLDLSTGEFRTTELDNEQAAIDEVARIDPREVLVSTELSEREEFGLRWRVLDGRCVNVLESTAFDPDRARSLLCGQFGVQTLAGFGCEALSAGIGAAGALLDYARATQCSAVTHLTGLVPYTLADYMVLDDATRRNLELTSTLREGRREGSLLGAIDSTVTAMGSRTLRRWVLYPLQRRDDIERRLGAVEELLGRGAVRQSLREKLAGLADLERINARMSAFRATPRDLVALRGSLETVPAILELASQLDADYFRKDRFPPDPIPDVAALIAQSLVDEPPANAREGGMIRPGYNARLDALRDLSGHGKGWIAELEARERARTKIGNLKIRYNRVFGYFIEVTKSNLALVPPDYERRQTLANAERYVTPELKEWESKVLTADDEAVGLEREVFEEIQTRVRAEAGRIAATAGALSRLDALAALAQVAHSHRYVRPVVDTGNTITIVEGRHPVIERASLGERFVPNDLHLDDETHQLLILTGPNMAGKSTVLRQAALIVLMAQMGSFVPAKSARVGLVDRIFTRVGASDSLARGQSTFMVEMIEAANILHNATSRSLVILDEIGRGTSTFDGISIAWAIAEHLHDVLRARTLFATHYHELTDLARTKPRVRNYHIAVKEWNGRVIFLRKLLEGGTSHSYGIEVARLAGLPGGVLGRAKEILVNLEQGEFDEWGSPRLAADSTAARRRTGQLGLFAASAPGPGSAGSPEAVVHRPDPVRDALRATDIETLSPLEALNLLHRLKQTAEGSGREGGPEEGEEPES